MAYKVGIDIGGTFTDLYAYDTETEKSLCLSSSSTPENYANGVMNVIEKAGIKQGFSVCMRELYHRHRWTRIAYGKCTRKTDNY